ncbi:MAG TPA: hypothetical protein VIH73_07010, partial [Acidimicrobiales bacterium]
MNDFANVEWHESSLVDADAGDERSPIFWSLDEDGDVDFVARSGAADVSPGAFGRPGEIDHADDNRGIATSHASVDGATEW